MKYFYCIFKVYAYDFITAIFSTFLKLLVFLKYSVCDFTILLNKVHLLRQDLFASTKHSSSSVINEKTVTVNNMYYQFVTLHLLHFAEYTRILIPRTSNSSNDVFYFLFINIQIEVKI